MATFVEFLGFASPFLVLSGLFLVIYLVGPEEVTDRKDDEE